MKLRSCMHMAILTGLTLVFQGCGGGGGGSSTTPVTVTAAQNPLLVNYSTTVSADFSSYVTTVKTGSVVNFSVTPGATVTPTGVTSSGGIATTKIKSTTPGTYQVTAAYPGFAGSAPVSFITQPSTVDVLVSSKQNLNNLSALTFNVTNALPATFTNYSTTVPSGNALSFAAALTPKNLSASWASGTSFSLDTSSAFLMKLHYTIPTDVPNFAVDSTSVSAIFTNLSTVRPTPGFAVKSVYYDQNGKQLYP
ncbi:Ig-like domain-containing protein [Geobacter sp. AOG2]|uniref:Ig-like domain-containing protein n=1 Tax=Geobacter sp. AOG2 TaxID=1566347 RepID=UPI001CC43C45|nr:Ig-like domain-containing protein [Geobacter sp. AOG2]GFE60550.1 hypothetical protein AOG2_11380 [Geobacter sp. AOG2]